MTSQVEDKYSGNEEQAFLYQMLNRYSPIQNVD